MRTIERVNLEITTLCDRACPHCCANIHNRPAVAHPWSYFEEAARWFQGIKYVHLTGGEPTMHPEFREFVPKFKPLFDCRYLTTDTNGAWIEKYEDVLPYFDTVYFTRYEGNGPAEWWLNSRVKHLIIRNSNHIPRFRRGSGAPCERGTSETVMYSNGRIYGCCVGQGVDGVLSLAPDEHWRERIETLPLPCRDCWFSPE